MLFQVTIKFFLQGVFANNNCIFFSQMGNRVDFFSKYNQN